MSHPGHLVTLDWYYPISNGRYLPSPELEGSEHGMMLSSLTTDADEGSKLIATEEQEVSEKKKLVYESHFQSKELAIIDSLKSRTRVDQHKCLPHLPYINPTSLFVEYFSVFGP